MTGTLEQAETIATRTLAAIDVLCPPGHRQIMLSCYRHAADRSRVASDLDGLRDHRVETFGTDAPAWCRYCRDNLGETTRPWPCRDAVRYWAGLIGTAEQYGVTVPVRS